jgi:hypothetical protein
MARRQHLVGATCSARRKQRYRDPKQRAAPPSAAPPHASKRSLGAKTHGTLTGVVVNSVGHRAQSKALRPSQPLQAWNLATFSRDFAVQQGAPRRKPRTPFTAWGKRTSLNVPGLTLQLFTLKVYSSSERKHTVTRIPRPKDPPFRHHGWVVYGRVVEDRVRGPDLALFRGSNAMLSPQLLGVFHRAVAWSAALVVMRLKNPVPSCPNSLSRVIAVSFLTLDRAVGLYVHSCASGSHDC